MSEVFRLQGTIDINTDKATSSLKDAQSQLKETASATDITDKSSANWKKTLVGLGKTIASTFALKKVTGFYQECIEGANAQIKAESKLEQAFKATGKGSEQQVQALKEHASALQKIGVIGDEVGMVGMAQLGTFNLSTDAVKTLSGSMYDLAVNQYGYNVSQEQMQQVGNLVGKVMTGQVSALSRYGVTLTDAQKKVLETGNEMERAAMLAEVLGNNVGGMNEKFAQTPEGKYQQLQNDLGDLKELIGMQIIPIVSQFVVWIQQLVSWFNTLSPTTQKVIVVVGIIVSLLPGLIGLISGIVSIIGGLGITISISLGWLLLIPVAIAAVVAAGIWLCNNWTTVKAKCSEVWNNVSNTIGTIVGKIKLFLSQIISNVTNWSSNMASKAQQAGSKFVNNVVSFVTSLPGKMANLLTSAISKVTNFVSQMRSKATQAAQGFVTNIKNGLSNLPSQMVSIGGNIVQGIIRGISGAAGNLFTSLKNLATNALNSAKGALGIKSPSRVFANEVGKHIPEGISVGIEANTDTLYDKINGLSMGISDSDIFTNNLNKKLNLLPNRSIDSNVTINHDELKQTLTKAFTKALEKVDSAVYMDSKRVGVQLASSVKRRADKENRRQMNLSGALDYV